MTIGSILCAIGFALALVMGFVAGCFLIGSVTNYIHSKPTQFIIDHMEIFAVVAVTLGCTGLFAIMLNWG